ncbi:MAG: MFS transporter [Bacilli bacterium]|nr:MFS transporter [Bacilli bacterium]
MKKKAYLLIVLYFVYGISVSLIHPVTPEYVISLNLNDLFYGVFFSMMALGMFVGSLFFGWMSKRFKRTPLLCLGILGYALGQALFGFVNTIPSLILVWRFFGGFCVAAPWAFYATFANDLTRDNNSRDRLILMLAPIEIIGEAAGYKIGGFLYSNTVLSFEHIFIIQVSLLTILSILTFFILQKEDKKLFKSDQENAVKKQNLVSFNKTLIPFFGVIALTTISTIMTTKYAEKYIIEIGFNSNDLGTIMMVTALSGVVASLIYTLLAKKCKINYRIVHCFLIGISSISVLITFLIPASSFLVAMYTTYTIFYISKCLTTSTDTRIVIDSSNEGNKGFHMGIRQASIAFGNCVGPLIAGAVYSTNHLWCFYMSSITFAATLIFSVSSILISNAITKKEELRSQSN